MPDIKVALPDDRALYGHAAAGHSGPFDALLTRAVTEGDGQKIAVDHRWARDVGVSPGARRLQRLQRHCRSARRGALGGPGGGTGASSRGCRRAFGRGQVIDYLGRRVGLVLVKNPADSIRRSVSLCDEPTPSGVLIAINDHHADGRDVSWLWDASVEALAATPHRFGAGGIRSADMALRFKYAGIEAWSEQDDRRALERLANEATPGEMVYLIPTYTAMLSFLEMLLPGQSPEEVWS